MRVLVSRNASGLRSWCSMFAVSVPSSARRCNWCRWVAATADPRSLRMRFTSRSRSSAANGLDRKAAASMAAAFGLPSAEMASTGMSRTRGSARCRLRSCQPSMPGQHQIQDQQIGRRALVQPVPGQPPVAHRRPPRSPRPPAARPPNGGCRRRRRPAGCAPWAGPAPALKSPRPRDNFICPGAGSKRRRHDAPAFAHGYFARTSGQQWSGQSLSGRSKNQRAEPEKTQPGPWHEVCWCPATREDQFMATKKETSAIDLLMEQHREVEKLFSEFEKAKERRGQGGAVRDHRRQAGDPRPHRGAVSSTRR